MNFGLVRTNAIALSVLLCSSSACSAGVVFSTSVLDSSFNATTTFNPGESGFLDIAVELDGLDLTTPVFSVQTVISLDNDANFNVTPGNALEVVSDDYHTLAPGAINIKGEGDVTPGAEYTTGELSIPPTTPTLATASLYRLPFTVGLGAVGGAVYNFAVLDAATLSTSLSTWNSLTAGLDFASSGSSFTINSAAVPEPSTWAVLGLGLGCLAVSRRRRKVAATQAV